MVLEPAEEHELDNLIQQLRISDPRWLLQTLQARHSATAHKAPTTDETTLARRPPWLTVDSQYVTEGAVWPFDRTTSLLDIQPQLVSDYIRFIHEFDWSTTELGPMSAWDTNMRRKVNMCLSDKQAGVLWIGPQFVSFYNEAYAKMIGKKHPLCLGQAFRSMWHNVDGIDEYETMLTESFKHGISSASDKVEIVTDYHGFREESWFSYSVNPIPDAFGGVFGSYNTTNDITTRVVSSRRHVMLLRLIQAASHADSTQKLWAQILSALEDEIHDVPFAVLYAADSVLEKDNKWALQGTVGVSSEHFPAELDMQTASCLSPAFDEAMAQRQPYLITAEQGTFSIAVQKLAKSRTHGDQCQSAVLLPIAPSDSDGVLAFMLLAINPLARYDADHEQLLSAIMHECTSALASRCLIEGQSSFADRLSKELIIKQEQYDAAETRFRRMADLSPAAMFHLDHSGRVIYANTAWRDLTGVPEELGGTKPWMDYIFEDDKAITEDAFTTLTRGEPISLEVRWVRSEAMKSKIYDTLNLADHELWTIASAYPEFDSNGAVNAIYGCLTDITAQKWLQDSQERELKDALELKRQQENFMDMISHEMRNPMSAIVLTVESIAHELSTASPDLNGMLDSTEVIMTCVQHQKRIVDDVLTLSKFDSGLLDICPVPTNLTQLLATTVKLFDAELKKHDINMEIVVDQSYTQECLRVDPSRLQQIIINLVTNAIKFTSSEQRRSIKIILSASHSRPATSLNGCEYVDNNEVRSGEIFVCFEVVDTGRGMTAEESAKLFHKFTQASAKTYAEYGGSGLGLFICKQLCKLQDGAIGVRSVLGEGTTFAFYISALHCAPVDMSTEPKRVLTGLPKSGDVHILLVEDNVINQRVLRTTLERAKYSVQVANHGIEALEHISRSSFATVGGVQLDVVLLDVEMPVCDGLECARRVRAQQKAGHLTGHVPIIGVTANARAEQQQLAIDAGMDTVVTKPFKLQQLVQKLNELGIGQ